MYLEEERILARIDRLSRERIAPAAFTPVADCAVAAWPVPGDGEPVPTSQVAQADFHPVTLPYAWGRAWSTCWFTVQVPQSVVAAAASAKEGPDGSEFDGSGSDGSESDASRARVSDPAELWLDIDLGFKDDWPGNQCEGMLYTADFTPVKAVNSRNRRHRLRLPAEALTFHVEAAANPDMMEHGTTPTELGDRLTAPEAPLYELRTARVVQRNLQVWHLWHDLDVLRGMAPELPADSTRRAQILCALDDAADALDPHDVIGTAKRARRVLAPLLASPAAASAQQVTAIGHAHIDSAWLWPVRETVRKVARTFANVDALMQEYPEFTFTATSAQQYAWLKEHAPEVFARVKARIAEGRWFPSGGMWVESDANLPGGEALIRQFTYGTRFFEREFHVRSRTLWLPDSFGYSAALPQIARLMGMTGFVTQKISWSKTNRYPHTTFWWEGVDSTRIFTHFPPVDCYDSMLTADEIAAAERNHRDRGRTPYQVLPFGYGDGGGGPTATMMERARRRENLDSSPRIQLGDPDAFIATAHDDYADRAPVHRGELYLEFHRGVFTSQLEMKQGNRRSEHQLRTVELLAALQLLQGQAPIEQHALDQLWERTLLLQFHDILPGSSIAWVHRDARADYEWIAQETAALANKALTGLIDNTDSAANTDSAPAHDQVVLNAAGHERTAVLEVPDGLQLVRIPGNTLAPLSEVTIPAPASVTVHRDHDPHGHDQIVLANGLIQAVITADGTVGSLRDLTADRELIAPGAHANQLQLFTDLPNEFDAWDIDRHYRGTPQHGKVGDPTRIEVTQHDPLRAVVTIERLLGDSPAIQTVTLDAASPRLDFTLEVDWRERETLLKVAFPLAIQARDVLAEIQFGHLARPLHENTSWEFAKFEAPFQRWIMAADGSYGAAILTDSTYGYDAAPWRGESEHAAARGTVLRPSLMRSPNWPDPRADLSSRRLAYSLLADADPARATAHAQALNLPLVQAPGSVGAMQVVQVDDPRVNVEAILPAADDSGDLIVRLYEASGSAVSTQVRFGCAAARVWDVDPLDDPLPAHMSACEVIDSRGLPAGEGIAIQVSPFQIRSLRITPELDEKEVRV